MRTSAGIVLLACLTFAQGPAGAGEPKPLTLKEACRRLERAQVSTRELTQRYRAVETVDGKPDAGVTIEVHRAGAISAMLLEADTGSDDIALFLADEYGLRMVRQGRIAYAMAGPAEIATVTRPINLARDRLLRRWSVQADPAGGRGWLFSAGVKGTSAGGGGFSVHIVSTELRGEDLLVGWEADDATISTHPEAGTVRFHRKGELMEFRLRDGLLIRWELRRPATRTVFVLEAIPGGKTTAAWAQLIGDAQNVPVPTDLQLRLEDLYPGTRGSLPAHAVRWALLDLSEAVPAFWTDLDRLRKAIDELIPAYLEARRAMEDGIPYVLGPLILDLTKSFETHPPEDDPRGAERAAVVALLARSLRELSAAGRRESGEGR